MRHAQQNNFVVDFLGLYMGSTNLFNEHTLRQCLYLELVQPATEDEPSTVMPQRSYVTLGLNRF